MHFYDAWFMIETSLNSILRLKIEGFKGFRGIIISGGTFSGVNRLVEDIQELYGNEVRTMGYLIYAALGFLLSNS